MDRDEQFEVRPYERDTHAEQALRRENQHLRERIAELEALLPEPPAQKPEPGLYAVRYDETWWVVRLPRSGDMLIGQGGHRVANWDNPRIDWSTAVRLPDGSE